MTGYAWVGGWNWLCWCTCCLSTFVAGWFCLLEKLGWFCQFGLYVSKNGLASDLPSLFSALACLV